MQNISLITYLIVCPLVFLAGFVDSIAGGGGLISLPAYLIAGLSPIQASATNKLSAFMGASVSFFNYAKKGFVKLKIAIPASIFAIIFSSIGAKVQTLIPENALKIFMLIALPISLIIMLNKNSFKMKNNLILIFGKKEFIKVCLISAIMGFYDGIYGPGTGTFLIILFVNVVKMTLNKSNGLAKAINFATNIGSLLYFIKASLPIFSLGIIAGMFNMIGSFMGSNLFIKKGSSITRPIMIGIMLIFIIKVLFEIFKFI